MFKDAKEELARLEQELLEEDLPDEEVEFSEQPTEPEDVYSYNTDPADIDLDELSEELLRPRSRSLRGFAIFMVIMTIVLVGLLCCMVLHNMGVL